MKMTDGNGKKYIWKILLALCLTGALTAFILLGVRAYRQYQAQEQLTELAEQANAEKTEISEEGGNIEESVSVGEKTDLGQESPVEEENASETSAEGTYAASVEQLEKLGIPVPEKDIDFQKLTETVNSDIYAWIYIPDTAIDYPVLQHPDNNTYYLKYNLDGTEGYPGCIYTENYNAKDFSDPNTVLYGHNMKNGTMFAGLHRFEDSDYFAKHPYIYIYTPEKLYVYEIFASYEYSNAHLLLNWDLTNEQVYERYLEEIEEIRSMKYNRKESVEVTTQNCIITLSTCVADKPGNRYLVQGVLLNEE